jgi:hypothetical protein
VHSISADIRNLEELRPRELGPVLSTHRAEFSVRFELRVITKTVRGYLGHQFRG